MKTCPFCAEEILDAAIVCKHCGRDLEQARPSPTVPPAPKPMSFPKTLVIAVAILGGIVVLGIVASIGDSDAPAAMLTAHREAVSEGLKAKAYTEPKSLILETNGFVVADWEVSDRLAIPPKTFGQDRLLLIREALLPFGFKNYRVNVNGPPPGTGLVRRYGSARLVDGGQLEWISP